MLPYKFQVPENSKKLRGQLFTYLYSDCDVKTISSADEIEKDRYLAFSHPFDDWVFDAIIKDKSINFFHIDNGYIGNPNINVHALLHVTIPLQNTVVRPVSESRRKLLRLTIVLGRMESQW